MSPTVRRATIVLSALISTVLAGPLYAIDPPDSKEQINGGAASPANAQNFSAVNVSAATYPEIVMEAAPVSSGAAFIGTIEKPRTYSFNNSESTNDPKKDKNGGKCTPSIQGDPIDVSKGTAYTTYVLFALPGEMGLTYVRYYNTSFVGNKWVDNLDYHLDTQCVYNPNNNGNCQNVKYYRPDGSAILFNGQPGGETKPYGEVGGGGLVALSYDSASATYTLKDETTYTLTFQSNGALTSITDASGIGWKITYTASGTTVTHTNGQSFTITTQTASYGSYYAVTDPGGNVYTYGATPYGSDGLTFPGTPSTAINFKYNNGFTAPPAFARLNEVDYNGVPYQYTGYVMTTTSPFYGHANQQYLADGSQNISIAYSTDPAGNEQAIVTNPLGHNSTLTYDGTNGTNGAYNGQLSLVSDDAVADCGATVNGRTYDTNGNLAASVDDNGNTHTYSYSANGQLQTETEAYGTPLARTTDYVWDPNQQLNRLLSETVEGWNKTTYSYNAQNRLASVAVTNLSSNGSANQTLTTTYGYTLYANGMVQTMTVTSPSPNGSATTTTNYDALGNVTSVSNGLGQTTTYSNYTALGQVGHVVGPNGDVTDYTYDGRSRVATKTTYPNGVAATWTSTYDGFGLLYTLTGPDGQVTTWNRDTLQRVQTITHNDKDGTSTESFSYDAKGDVLEHKIARGSVVGLDEVFHYDALGHVYQKVGQHGQSLTYAYDGNGNVLSVTNAVGHSVVNQYDALNRLTQSTEAGGASPAMPASAPSLNVPSSSNTGGYTVSWSSVTGATFYVLQEQVNGGAWSNIQSSAALSWAPTAKANNTYGYRVEACNATGCGPWSNVGSVVVSVPTAPTSAPSLTVPGSSANGNYTVSWTAVSNTSTYTLQEQVNGGAWSAIQSGTALSWSVNGRTNGTYAYRSQACNAVGCGPWSNTGTMVVAWPPVPAVPSISVPTNNYTGSYTISWGGVANAANYPLYQSINGGAWTLVQNSGATSWTTSGQANGQYSYLVSACDISGCSGQSSGSGVLVIPTPIAINGQQYVPSRVLTTGTGSAAAGFDIAGGTTWELFKVIPTNGHSVIASGAVPYGAVSVQYTWVDGGVPTGFGDAGGSVTTNQASSPAAISGNPMTEYITGVFNYKQGDHGHNYQLHIDFFDAHGVNVSSSVCALSIQVVGTQ